MQVAQYIFQSPSTSSVQVGRLDPSTKKEEETTAKTAAPQQDTPKTNQTSSNRLLDVYA